MPIEFRNVTVVLAAGKGRRDIERTETFASRVRSADAAIKGFSLDYVTDDEHTNVIAVDIDILEVKDREVRFLVQTLYGDRKIDDPYHGFVNVLVIADLERTSSTEVPEVPNPPIQG